MLEKLKIHVLASAGAAAATGAAATGAAAAIAVTPHFSSKLF